MSPRRFVRPLAFVLAVSCPVLIAALAVASDMGQAAANQVQVASYQNYLNTYLYTHAGQNRGIGGAEHDLARDNIRTLMEGYGLTVTLESFTYNNRTGNNVVGTKLGTLYPEQVYIIGAHYDDANNPGADDNASGMAGVLEIARILQPYPSEYTIKYIGFDMEELGLIGSQKYVIAHPGELIEGMISLDMICFDPNTNQANIYGRTASDPIKQALATAVAEYSGGITATIYGQADYSDHAPFESAGYQACLLIESGDNPYYHTQNDNYDRPGYLNFNYAAKMTRSVIGWLVDAAHVDIPISTLRFDYPRGQPRYAAPQGGTAVRIDVTGLGDVIPRPGSGLLHFDGGHGWQTAPLISLAPNSYAALLPAGDCNATLHYYVSAEAMDGRVFADPRGAPATYYSAVFGYQTDFYVRDFDTDPGWNREGYWTFGRPLGLGGEHGGPDPNAGHTGTNVFGYNLAGDYPNLLPQTHLTSSPIDCTGRTGVHLCFWRWLGVEAPSSDHAWARVSNNNGTTWTTVWQNTTEITDTSWHEMDLDISAVADNQPAVRLRWTMGTTDETARYCGWNIDDVALRTTGCERPYPAGDLNCDGSTDFNDINPFVLALTNVAGYLTACPTCNIMNGDVNGDGAVNFGDINPFVELLSPA